MISDEEFEERPVRQSDELTLALDGWEGPLDLLLNLARAQKVDLRRFRYCNWSSNISPICRARALKLEIAADYLVMAAACLPEVLPAAAQGSRAGSEP